MRRRRMARLEIRVTLDELRALRIVARELVMSVSELLRLAAATMAAEYREEPHLFDRRRSQHPVEHVERRRCAGRRAYD